MPPGGRSQSSGFSLRCWRYSRRATFHGRGAPPARTIPFTWLSLLDGRWIPRGPWTRNRRLAFVASRDHQRFCARVVLVGVQRSVLFWRHSHGPICRPRATFRHVAAPLGLLVDFKATRDEEPVDSDEILSGPACVPGDRQLVLDAAKLVVLLEDASDYGKSPEFESSVCGKSDSYRNMKARNIQKPEKCGELQERMRSALARALVSGRLHQSLSQASG